jgi:hypothetical protein
MKFMKHMKTENFQELPEKILHVLQVLHGKNLIE